jgi:hypothetical protein
MLPPLYYFFPGMPVATRADKISHGLCLFPCYPYTFAMIPFFALVTPDHELPPVWELQTAIEGAHRVARETLKQSQKRMKRDYDVKVRVKELKLGDLVYQLDTATVKGKTRKLSPSWK